MGVLIIWLVTSSLLSYSSAKYDGGCDRCVHRSNVAISDNDFMSNSGTCEYGGDATEFNTEYPAGARDSIYQKGAGCGATYQVRCTNKTICDVKGIEVIVTTNASELNDDNADFMLSKKAFNELFKKNIKVPNKPDRIEFEYKRIPSVYGEKKPMSIRVEIMDKNDFAVKLLYQGGQTYIKSIAMAFYNNPHNTWFTMKRRNEGTIWEVKGITVKNDWLLKFKFTVIEGFEDKDYETDHFVKIEKERDVYGLGLQLDHKIAKEKCITCDKTNWR